MTWDTRGEKKERLYVERERENAACSLAGPKIEGRGTEGGRKKLYFSFCKKQCFAPLPMTRALAHKFFQKRWSKIGFTLSQTSNESANNSCTPPKSPDVKDINCTLDWCTKGRMSGKGVLDLLLLLLLLLHLFPKSGPLSLFLFPTALRSPRGREEGGGGDNAFWIAVGFMKYYFHEIHKLL